MTEPTAPSNAKVSVQAEGPVQAETPEGEGEATANEASLAKANQHEEAREGDAAPPAAAVATRRAGRSRTSRSREAATAHRPAAPRVRRLPDRPASVAPVDFPKPTRPAASAPRTAVFSAAVLDELIGSVSQAQSFTLDMLTTWVDVIGKVVPRFPGLPFVPARSDVVEGFGAGFEVAKELLASQRKFALDLASVLAPAR